MSPSRPLAILLLLDSFRDPVPAEVPSKRANFRTPMRSRTPRLRPSGSGLTPALRPGRRGGAPRTDGFFGRVYAVVRRIPRGRVLTYGQVAALLGDRRWARTVGWALGACPSNRIPCHRVVNSRGARSRGYGSGHPERQRARLEAEGVRFRLDGTLDLATYGWLGPLRAGRRSRLTGRA